ncbi:MAG: sensor histidine kinase, partial [Flavobacteriales bacterium]
LNNYALFLSSGIVLLLGLAVIVGWFLNSSALVQLHKDLVPMQFNTALGFIFCATATLSIGLKQFKVSAVSASLAGVLGTLTILQYIFDFNLGIDELFMEHTITVKTSHPGRMAPNTALSFILLSISLFLAKSYKEKTIMASFILASIVIGLALLALTGYFFDVERAYGWANLTRMALHTALGFLLLAAAIIVYQSGKPGFIHQFESTSLWRLSHLLVLTVLILIIDVSTQLGMAIGLLYAIVLLLSFFYHTRYTIPLFAAISIGFTLIGFFASPDTGNHMIGLLNRGLTISAIVLLTYFMLKIKKSEVTLKQNKEDLEFQVMKVELAMKSSKMGFWEVNILTGEYVWDKQMFDLYGVQESDTFGAADAWAQGMLPEEQERIQGEYDEAIKNDTPFNSKFRVMRPDGELRTVNSHGKIIPNADGVKDRMIGLNWDVTEEARATKAIEDYSELLEQKNKELNEFSYIASHDLQEPINTMTAFSDLLGKQYDEVLDDTAKEYLTYIKGSGVRAKELISDLLDYNRLGTKKELVPIDLNELVNNVRLDLSSSLTNNDVRIIVGSLPRLNGYEIELRQLFQNIIGNAIKFNTNERDSWVKVTAKQFQSHVQITIEDNGIGIEEKNFNKIFAVFKRLHSKTDYPGTGIGLAHCKKIAEMHQGKIWVESEFGKGSSFHFNLSTKL